jgi:hypothetical protein
MNKVRRHLNYSNVMSMLALFLALGGGSVAIAGTVADNSVDSGSVVNESLKSRDLKDGEAVESSDVVDEQLGASDIGTDGVTASEIGTSEVGSSEVGSNAIGGSELATGSVFSSDIFDGTIIGTDIGDGQVDASEIGEDGFYRGDLVEDTFDDTDGARNGDYGLDDVVADCSTATEDGELVSADIKWVDDSPNEDELFISEIKLNMATDTATVLGGNDTGNERTLQASAVCLAY